MEQAAQKGAAAILTQKPDKVPPDNIHIIYTNNTLRALQALAAWYLKSFDVPVAAITGSTGKTTTKDMIYSVLSEKYSVLRTQGNFNNEIGLPLTLFHLEPHHQIAVLEMGMSGFGEIRRLTAIAPPRVAVMTNIGVSHIEKLGSRENILKAKSEIFERFDAGCTAVLNDDNDLLHQAGQRMLDENAPYSVLRFGTGPDADYRAEDIRLLGETRTEYTLALDGERVPIALNVPGKHNVYNSLAAIAVGRAFGLSLEEIRSGLLKFTGGKMRLNIFRLKTEADVKVIDDAYNASPDSVNAALRILQEMEGGRKIAILGDMLELGEYSQKAHRQVGEMAAKSGIDILVAKGRDSIWIGEGAMEAGMPAESIYHMQDNQDVIDWLNDRLSEGDRILIKGSRGMQMEQIVAYLKNRRVSE
jgi:UDP-N-acetylmuramoyl-tripeptide--D-alanyl-D-alanine ligase